MAVVFISPKQRQKMFFAGITATFVALLIVIFLMVFLSKPNEVSFKVVSGKPRIQVDMSVFDSYQFKNLQPLAEMNVQYSYQALNKNRQLKTGFISADSIEQARATLEGMGLTISELREVINGRDNPFVPYYKPATVSGAGNKK